MNRAAALLLPLLLITACRSEDDRPQVDAESARTAERTACVTEYLLERARDDLETVTEMLPEAGEELGRHARGPDAIIAFTRAYLQQAEVAAAHFAHRDSSLNAATTREDSARYAQRAESLRLSPPEAEGLEENVSLAYQRNLQMYLNDPELHCNEE
jgi:hypothetical protein